MYVAVPVVVVFGAFYIWYKSQKGKPVTVTNDPATTPPLKPSPSLSSGNFPLQQGMKNNSLVKTLQNALGVTVDGSFGPITLAALQAQYGMSTVPDQNTLTAIVNAANSGAMPRQIAQNVLTQFQSGSYDIYVNNPYYADQVIPGTSTPNGTGFQLSVFQTYDNRTYTLIGVTGLGQLIMNVQSGPLAGQYLVDPSSITLNPHTVTQTVYNPAPSVDPGSGLTTF